MDALSTTLFWLDYAAVAVFGATGALAAAHRKHDIIPFGFFAAITTFASYLLILKTHDLRFLPPLVLGGGVTFMVLMVMGIRALTSLFLAYQISHNRMIRMDEGFGDLLAFMLKSYGKQYHMNDFIRWVTADDMRHLKLMNSCAAWRHYHPQQTQNAITNLQTSVLELVSKFVGDGNDAK